MSVQSVVCSPIFPLIIANFPICKFFGRWEGTGEPARYPHGHEKNMQNLEQAVIQAQVRTADPVKGQCDKSTVQVKLSLGVNECVGLCV